jgi:hypothetical protein
MDGYEGVREVTPSGTLAIEVEISLAEGTTIEDVMDDIRSATLAVGVGMQTQDGKDYEVNYVEVHQTS